MADRPRNDGALAGADGLRTLACLMVVFHHLSQELAFRPQIQAPEALKAVTDLFTSSGSAGVSVFFVLSGFLLAVPFWRAWYDGSRMPDLRVYAARRAGRIMPGFYLNLSFFAVLALLFEPQAPAVLWRYFAGLTFTSGFHPVTFFPVDGNGPLWSIGFEVVSYALLPVGMAFLFLVPGKSRTRTAGAAVWAVLWLAVFAANQGIQDAFPADPVGRGWQNGLIGGAQFWMPRYNPVGFFGHFSLGTLAAGLAVSWSRSSWTQTRHRLFDVLSLVLFVLWAGLLVSRTNQDQFSWNLQGQPYYYPAFPLLSAALLACLTQSRWAARIFDNPFSRHTARVSFGLYLWHTFVISRFNGAIGDTFEWLLLVAVTLGLSYLVATLSWVYFEEPILKRVQRWRPGVKATLEARKSRFVPFLAASALILVAVPLGLTAGLRPTAALWPTPSDTAFTFLQRGPVTGLTYDGATAYAVKNGSEIHRILPDKTSSMVYLLDEEPAEVRLSFDVPKLRPLDTPVPGLSVIRSGQPWLWNLRFGPDGNLYAAASTQVLVLSPDGSLLRSVPYQLRSRFGVMDVAFDPAGNLYASDGQSVFKDAPDGSRTVFLPPGTFQGQAAGLVFNRSGTTLFVCDYDVKAPSQSRILAVPVTAGVPGLAESVPAPGAMFGAEGPEGDLVFSGALTGTLYRWRNGSLETLWCPNLGPQTAVAFGPDGRLTTAGWYGTLGRAVFPGGAP